MEIVNLLGQWSTRIIRPTKSTRSRVWLANFLPLFFSTENISRFFFFEIAFISITLKAANALKSRYFADEREIPMTNFWIFCCALAYAFDFSFGTDEKLLKTKADAKKNHLTSWYEYCSFASICLYRQNWAKQNMLTNFLCFFSLSLLRSFVFTNFRLQIHAIRWIESILVRTSNLMHTHTYTYTQRESMT